VRQRLHEVASLFVEPRLLTLTIGRSAFASPREAWQAVADRQAVSKLLAGLGVRRWVWALEFQMKTETNGHRGWPHWHVLIDLSTCPGGRLDLERAWYLWRDLWGLGGLDFRYKKTVAQSGMHGVNYITKYLTKMPREGFPDWVLGSASMRFVQGCRLLGPLVSEKRNIGAIIGRREGEQRRAGRRPLGDRVRECSTGITVFRETLDKSTGEKGWRWVGTLRGSLGALAEIRGDACEEGSGHVHVVAGVVGVEKRSVMVRGVGTVRRLCERYELRLERGSV
jgi:hypothetical protein